MGAPIDLCWNILETCDKRNIEKGQLQTSYVTMEIFYYIHLADAKRESPQKDQLN